jgi:hypothetical protein
VKNTTARYLLICALALLLAAWLTACQSLPTRTTTDLSRLQGYWQGRGPGGDCSVTISGNSLRFHARADFWYETTFTLPAGTDPKQLHATIVKDSSSEQVHIGTVVVAIFKIEDGKLTLGVVEDFDGPPAEAVVGDWDWVMDIYHLERAQPPENQAV